MKTKKERIFYYDMLRAFAIIAVIICHVDFYFGNITTPVGILAKMTFHDIGRIGVPIFLMISGALLLNRDYTSLGDFIKRRFTRIVTPFIFWIILITLTNIHFHKSYAYMWNVFIGNPSIMVFLDFNRNLSCNTYHQHIHKGIRGKGSEILPCNLVYNNNPQHIQHVSAVSLLQA